mmetsp:Transcript_8066/g.24294  ORF Transcript_8066/g.24294 Transcript_8066/m.24294 type:complete len:102 (-) Transcript_8066:1562-1867(-)
MVEEGTNPDFFFGGIDNVRFRKPIVPGDTLVMEAKITALKERFGIVKTKARGFVDGKLAVEADLCSNFVARSTSAVKLKRVSSCSMLESAGDTPGLARRPA